MPRFRVTRRIAAVYVGMLLAGAGSGCSSTALGGGDPDAAVASASPAGVSGDGQAEPAASPSGEAGPAIVREITPLEYGEVIVACMAEFGFVAHAIDGGEGVRYEQVPPEQNEALEDAYDECRARYPTAEIYTRPLSEEQLGILYDYWVEERIPCLEAESISGFDPPSRATFVSSPDYGRWSPEDRVADAAGSGERLNELLELCPRRPPLERLYGEQAPG